MIKPTSGTRQYIEQHRSKRVKDRRKELRVAGRGAGVSTAQYPIHTTNPDVKALKKGLEIWNEIQWGLTNVQVATKLRKYFPVKEFNLELTPVKDKWYGV